MEGHDDHVPARVVTPLDQTGLKSSVTTAKDEVIMPESAVPHQDRETSNPLHDESSAGR